jgi:membrane protease YdiL (CAAX protease family)
MVLIGMAVYVAAVLLKCRPRYVIPSVAAGGLLFAAWVLVRDAQQLGSIGLATDNLPESLAWIAPATLVFAGLLLAYARWTGKNIPPRRLLLLLPIYLVWGFVQQCIFQGILNRRLMELTDSAWAVALVVGLAFAAVHAPRWWLVALTMVAGPIWSFIYLMSPNLYTLAASHALLGGLAYFCVSGEDPLMDI